MERYFIVKIKEPKRSDDLVSFFSALLNEEDFIHKIKDDLIIILTSKDLHITLESVIKNLSYDLGITINIMFSHNYFSYYDELMSLSFNYFKNATFSIYEFLLSLNISNNKKYNKFIIDEFKNVQPFLLDTCEMYIRSNLNALETASKIHIHRNTVLLRINSFIEKTSLDIRDFYNASYFFLYLKIR